MKLFGKSNPDDTNPDQTAKETRDADPRMDLLIECVNALFVFVREYTLDITEIDSERFKSRLEALQEKFRAEEKTKAIFTEFDRQKSGILDHIQRQKNLSRRTRSRIQGNHRPDDSGHDRTGQRKPGFLQQHPKPGRTIRGNHPS